MLRAINAELRKRVRARRSATSDSQPKAYQLWYYTNEPAGDELYPSYVGYNLNSIVIANDRASAVLSINRHVRDQTKAIGRNVMDIVESTAEYALPQFEEQYGVEFSTSIKQHVEHLTGMMLADLFDEENDTMHIKEYPLLLH
jgi:hypothetical protein